MARVTAILVSADTALAASVRDAVGAIADLQVEVVTSYEEAHGRLCRPDLAMVLAHLGRRKNDAEAVNHLLDLVGLLRRAVAVIVLCEQADAELALALTQRGAAECLERPLNLHRLGYLADVLTIRARHQAKTSTLPVDLETVTALGAAEPFLIPGGSAEAARMKEQLLRMVPRDTTVLFTGETGTGKSHLARLLHELSPRRKQPFQVVSCAGLSAALVESELFGHVKGAFTGAERDRIGKCAEVGQGTLVLEEVDALSLELQGKLLRLVEDRVFEPLGSNRALSLQARLIVASNRKLENEVAASRFRSDLYYRLNVVEFHVPALRERPTLLRPLAEHFLLTLAAKMDRQVRGFTPDALEALCNHAWPGNIRELRNVVERAIALGGGSMIGREDLPEYVRMPVSDAAAEGVGAASTSGTLAPGTLATPVLAPGTPTNGMPTNGMPTNGTPTTPTNGTPTTLAKTKEEAEAWHIAQALARNQNNRQRTAAELGISRMTLYKKLHRYGFMGAT